jgi:hypothetical protein
MKKKSLLQNFSKKDKLLLHVLPLLAVCWLITLLAMFFAIPYFWVFLIGGVVLLGFSLAVVVFGEITDSYAVLITKGVFFGFLP